jgi:Zn-dependent peptidase ImmA (M78 family)
MNLYNLLSKEITQQELLNYYNATIIYDTLPKNTNGCVTNYRGINLIIINDKISHYYKRKTILHELAHIELNQLNQLDVELFAFKVNKYEDAAVLYINFLLKSVKESEENNVIIY